MRSTGNLSHGALHRPLRAAFEVSDPLGEIQIPCHFPVEQINHWLDEVKCSSCCDLGPLQWLPAKGALITHLIICTDDRRGASVAPAMNHHQHHPGLHPLWETRSSRTAQTEPFVMEMSCFTRVLATKGGCSWQENPAPRNAVAACPGPSEESHRSMPVAQSTSPPYHTGWRYSPAAAPGGAGVSIWEMVTM